MRKLFWKRLLGLCVVLAASTSWALNALIGITPVTREIGVAGGNGAILTSGSGRWTATTACAWIRLPSGSGNAGEPVGYLVDPNDAVESREGVILVEGKEFRVTQAGLGANLNVTEAHYECEGGAGSVKVSAPAGKTWHAHSNVAWLTVGSAVGVGAQALSYTVAPLEAVTTRSGTLTIADNTFTVTQTGRRMQLKESGISMDYTGDEVKVRITALADTAWTVQTPPAWIRIKSGASGIGSGTAVLQVERNENANARQAVVQVGSESFSVQQFGTTNLRLALGSREKAVGLEGLAARERVAVSATEGLTWSVSSDAAWIRVLEGATGIGNGAFAYTVEPNPALAPRSGVIVVTAGSAGVAPKKVEVTQGAAEASLTLDGYAFEAGGEMVDVGVLVPDFVAWSVDAVPAWMTVSALSGVGPASVQVGVRTNPSVTPRACNIRIAGRDFDVVQRGRGVQVSYEAKVFDTAGRPLDGSTENTIVVSAEEDVSWRAEVSDRTMLVLYGDREGHGSGEVKYIVAPYVGDGSIRTGTITIGDQVVYISQRPYELSIEPNGVRVASNSGAGEIQVALDFEGAWNAFTTEPWLECLTTEGVGSGRILYRYAENNTGKERTAKVVISGEIYTITQAARQNIQISTEVVGTGGFVLGGGVYNLGTHIELIARPLSGYQFDHWVLPDGSESSDETLAVLVQQAQTYQAVFAPMSPVLEVAETSLQGIRLEWTPLSWATTYRVRRGNAVGGALSTILAEIPASDACSYEDTTGALSQTYRYQIEAVGADTSTWSLMVSAARAPKESTIAYTNMRGTTHPNPATYHEGDTIVFAAPTARRGYTFLGWVPAQISPDTTGDVTVRATWLQNTYRVEFDANGGASEMSEKPFHYGFWRRLDAADVTRTGYVFQGWSTNPAGPVEYADGQSVKNLTQTLDQVVTLYVIWNAVMGIENDPAAIVTGNEHDGYVIRASAGMTEIVPRFPTGFDASKTILEIEADALGVLPKGARIRIVKGPYDITGYLDIPAPDAVGRINLANASVKTEYRKEVLDPQKGGTFQMINSEPFIRTAPTRPGLTYTLREGTKLTELFPGDSILGDGNPWIPNITIKEDESGFYSIRVTK